MYLANEVAQQSRARKKDEFPKAFGGVIAEAMEIAYRGTTGDIQAKLRRVLEVWRSRGVFEPAILSAIDQRLDGTLSYYTYTAIDKSKGKGIIPPRKSTSSPSIPPELVYPLNIIDGRLH
jgi:regulator of Ty1 transposition protein 103